MSNETKETGSSFMEKLSTFIVDKRNLIFLLTIILLIFSVFSRNWVEVESDLTYYLPADSETKQALNIMDEQFVTYGTAEIMVANITPEQAAALEPKIKELKKTYTIVIVTHNMQQAARISDKTAFFLLGKLVEMGETAKIFNEAEDSRTRDYVQGKFG